MEILGAASVAEVFISCKKEKHYSRELILPQPALVRVLSGEVRIASADRVFNFFAGDTMLIPRNQLGRMSKLPLNGEPCTAISIVFRREILQQYYAARQIIPLKHYIPELKLLPDHPLLESLFNSLLPYFKLADALSADIAAFKIEEAIRVLRAIDEGVDHLLGQFEEPGKLDLVDFMEKNYMFNLSLEKFGYLTGRSLTTYKKDFEKVFKSSPGKWLTHKRLELAHYEIFEKKRKPADVYLDVGFENLSHFSFAFKRQFGYNPSAAVK
ncbi:AraC family transcriptional regulator [Mucilaginibacter sp. BJC16-A38]|uniref:helix-turn-helix domain-containing protein n=1 Tax=Mucilaginibacter phenanthrenivorans TaxID=1234842 RepID=UPI00215738EA|nr:AraC family transcriptional regulator [Mucilaginibacter phenanthrenivorans]MCR8560278.1 AraC family transcriptional regulator [Mucilaginibacter phenanthrenivorans]